MIHEPTVERIFNLLNRVLKTDREMLQVLIETRVPCNEELTKDPEIQVIKTDTGHEVGLLGILNGIAGTIEGGQFDKWGPIMGVFEDDGTLSSFMRTEDYKPPNKNDIDHDRKAAGRVDDGRWDT